MKPPTKAARSDHESNLIRWLRDPRTVEFFGDSWKLKADVLAAVITGGNLSAIAREHGLTRSATSKQARRAKAIFGDLGLTK